MAVSAPLSPPRVLPLGDAAWTVDFGNEIDPATHGRVLGFCSLLDALSGDESLDGVIEWVPAFRSVTVYFDPERGDPFRLRDRLAGWATHAGSQAATGCRWHIPVCFDEDCAPDLADVAALKGLTREETVGLLTQTVFTVYMLGFLPGFPYLGGLPEALDVPRLATPRKHVPARSIAIAGRMCAAYPWDSPGGWRLLGRTPIRLFDVDHVRRPALLAPGDTVVWQAVNRDDYEEIDRQCQAGNFDLSTLLVEDGQR